MITPRRITNDVTELAKERNREAAERTLTSWIQSCLGIIGFGAGLDNIFTALHQAFPEQSLVFSLTLSHAIGLTAIGLGVFLLVLIMIPYRAAVKSLEREDYFKRPTRLLNFAILVSTITFYGLIAFVAVLFVLPWQ